MASGQGRSDRGVGKPTVVALCDGGVLALVSSFAGVERPRRRDRRVSRGLGRAMTINDLAVPRTPASILRGRGISPDVDGPMVYAMMRSHE